ncbi:MAG: diguanylate cyclase [Clostridium sp.]|nr:diguanylate cyclase [Clostridium sp.]
MIQSIISNGIAAAYFYRLSVEIHTFISSGSSSAGGTPAIIASSAPSVILMNSYTRIAIIIVSIFVAYSSERQRKQIKKLACLAYIDGTTGVYNYRYFQAKLTEEMEHIKGCADYSRMQTTGKTSFMDKRQAKTDQEALMGRNNSRAAKVLQGQNKIREAALTLIMIDLDNFGEYNDTNGHKAGDMLLAKTASVIKRKVKKGDIVCRYGGDRFVVLMRESNPDSILMFIESIRADYNQMISSGEGSGEMLNTTFSVGYSIYPSCARNKDELIMQADSALYQAKNTGRNNVQIYRSVFEEIKHIFNTNDHQVYGSVRALLGTVSAKDKYTLRHSERVMDYAVTIGMAMGLSNEKLRLLKIAALLHDIGKVEISESVLNKTEPLTRGEINILRKHPEYSVDILEPLKDMELLIDSIKYHHERYDGKGYPSGLKGKSIPLGARILCVADAFDAMLSDRPYRKGMRMEQVLAELKENSGTQFDPDTVKAFLGTFRIDIPKAQF